MLHDIGATQAARCGRIGLRSLLAGVLEALLAPRPRPAGPYRVRLATQHPAHLEHRSAA